MLVYPSLALSLFSQISTVESLGDCSIESAWLPQPATNFDTRKTHSETHPKKERRPTPSLTSTQSLSGRHKTNLRNQKLESLTENDDTSVVLRRPPTKPPRIFTASLVLPEVDVTKPEAISTSPLTKDDLSKLLRTKSVPTSTHIARDKKSSSSSSDSDDEKDSKKSSSRFAPSVDVPTSEASIPEIQNHSGTNDKQIDVNEPGLQQPGSPLPKPHVEVQTISNDKIKIIKNPRAMRKEPNQKLPNESKNTETTTEPKLEPSKNTRSEPKVESVPNKPSRTETETKLEAMPNFRMAHAATVSHHGPSKKSGKESKLKKQSKIESDSSTDEELIDDLSIFSPDYKPPPPPVAIVKTPINKKLPKAAQKKIAQKKVAQKKESLSTTPGKLTQEEEATLEKAAKEAEEKEKEEKERKERKLKKFQMKKEEEERLAQEKIAKSREFKPHLTDLAKPIESAPVQKTETLRQQLKNVMGTTAVSNLEQQPQYDFTPTTTAGIHLDLDSDDKYSGLLPTSGTRRDSSSSTSSSSSLSSDEDAGMTKQNLGIGSSVQHLVEESGKGIVNII